MLIIFQPPRSSIGQRGGSGSSLAGLLAALDYPTQLSDALHGITRFDNFKCSNKIRISKLQE